MRVRLLDIVVAVGCLVASQCAIAAASNAPNPAPPLSHLGLATQPVPLPGVGQIVFVFIGVAALAVGIAVALRRLSPGLLTRLQVPVGVEVTVLGRQRLEPGVSLHLVNVAGQRLAIVTSRSGVAMHAVPAADNGASGAAPRGDRVE